MSTAKILVAAPTSRLKDYCFQETAPQELPAQERTPPAVDHS